MTNATAKKVWLLVGIARDMIPKLDLIIKTVARFAIGATVIKATSLAPYGFVVEWGGFAGKMMVMFAIFGLIGHAEGAFMSHLTGAVRNRVCPSLDDDPDFDPMHEIKREMKTRSHQ